MDQIPPALHATKSTTPQDERDDNVERLLTWRPRARRGRYKTSETDNKLIRTFIAAQTSAARSWTRRLTFVVGRLTRATRLERVVARRPAGEPSASRLPASRDGFIAPGAKPKVRTKITKFMRNPNAPSVASGFRPNVRARRLLRMRRQSRVYWQTFKAARVRRSVFITPRRLRRSRVCARRRGGGSQTRRVDRTRRKLRVRGEEA